MYKYFDFEKSIEEIDIKINKLKDSSDNKSLSLIENFENHHIHYRQR